MPKTILVTGANRGIGFAIVKQYAKSGYTVLACYRDPEKASDLKNLNQTNNNIKIYQLDVTNLNNIAQLAAQLKNESIDILFNNAGVIGKNLAFGKLDYEDLMSTFSINSVAPLMIAQYFLENVAQSHEKKIINISSNLGSIELHNDNSWPWLSYRISKSALNSATRGMANQLKEKGIIVIAMHPGWVQTDMGGKNADITTEKSVVGMKVFLDQASLRESGNFFSYDGSHLPW